ncbi:aspartate aminotransferase family protein [Ligilactobacillus animalis]|uniref:aspartate aminotransferase family protein n=1 Tax=Ligilactobacillus animalis TaxID=1605 RepID=UPI0010A4FD11|nr:aspartate aminotransferase family protein [Ligilactobacillus animalis]MDO5883108.1 aspartate aminotransferase family protein [Ligilactobacillus animalis]MDU1486805.1 aspartate aminotransferase family protein [Ligilactobacillus animalis]MDU8987188.1 aspartate aminotransferase family protein [Ligilactobacillus animalis]THE22015.1 4-aminobutyrate aminotransferase [Ligilactobacillus animalis]THE22918.1 4-aminobutyrate aminotransferase [Ligilactobacillus animalis]
MAKNDELLHQEARSLASQSRIKYFDLVIAQGNGALLTDADGKEYIDLLASASSTNTGHCHPSVVQAIIQQTQKLIQYTPAYFANQIAAQLSTRLTKLAPMSGPVKLAWGNSGSDANDAIIKFARAYTGRQYIVTFTGAYHGSTYGSLTASGVSLNMTRKLGPLLPGIIKVPYPDPWQKASQETEEQFVERMFAAFKLPFETYLPPDEVACILIEPIQGDGGIIKAPTKYLQKVYEFAHEHGILFAVDEVNQGMGRTGKWWSIQHFELEPDLISVGKSLASGLPLSAVIGRAEIMEALDAPAHIFTTAGNPLTAAAALATIEIIEKEELLRRSTELGRPAATFFQQAQAKYDFIGDVRMYGLNGGIDIVDPKTKQPSTEIATKIIHRAFELGVIMISLRGNILRFQPPLVITTAQLEQAFAILEQVFSEEAAGKLQLPKNAAELGW